MKEATYNLADGVQLTVEYDETAPCRICGKPVESASVGGTDVCPWCDCGKHRDGRDWTYEETMAMIGKEPERTFWRKKLGWKERSSKSSFKT